VTRGWFDAGPPADPVDETRPAPPVEGPTIPVTAEPAAPPAPTTPPASITPPGGPPPVGGHAAPMPPAAGPDPDASPGAGSDHADAAEIGNAERGPAGVGEDYRWSTDVTTLLPPVVPDDRTAVIPRTRERSTELDEEPPDRFAPGATSGRTATPKGVTVIPLRPVRTEDGYKSVYSEVTRTTPGSVLRTAARGAGELLITLGLVVLLFAAYEVWGKAAIVGAEQNDLDKQLAQQWAQQPSAPPSAGGQAGVGTAALPPPSGNALARLYIPRLQKNWVVVQGVRQSDIRYAPGHYPETAMPGQVGNFSVAGHRTRSIFWDLDLVKAGDTVIVETAQTWFVYSVTQNHIVLPNAVQVVAPVPNQPGAKPSKAMLTITTCNPKFNNYQRLIVHAELVHSQPREVGRPAEIGG
jgi:LPXTG-site transpeptidase (sortase) family protein